MQKINRAKEKLFKANKQVIEAKEKAELAKKALIKIVKESLRFGNLVYWSHGSQERKGMVLEVGDAPKIKVRGESADFWIDCYRITAVKRFNRSKPPKNLKF